MAASFECKNRNVNINTSLGKAVFSGRGDKDAAGMRGFSCALAPGVDDFPKKEEKLKHRVNW